MKITFNRYIIAVSISAFLLISPYQVLAQDNVSDVLADFTIELEDTPPQPSQIPNSDVGNIDLNINQVDVESEKIEVITEVLATDVSQPTSSLDEVQITDQPQPTVQDIPYSGTYYDANSITDSSLTNTSAPRQVDPRYEPGSSFVVVQKSAKAGSVPARITAAQRAINLGRYSSALELYEGLYSETPKNVQVLMGLAVAQQKSGFTESAIATYEELLIIDADNTDALVNMLGLIKNQYPAVAFRRLNELWDSNPNNPYIAGELGLLSASLGRPQEALRYLGIASSLEPNNASHLFNMAVISDRVGQVKNAIELYEHALEVDISYGAGKTVERDVIYDRLSTLRRL